MLAKRIIPTVLVRGKTAYKGPGFGDACARSVGSALSICRTHASRGVDELTILDIAATKEGRGPDLDMVRQLSEGCFIPITVGGGVRSLGDIDALLRAGADKVAVCSIHREDPDFVERAADRFGSQAIVAVIEHNSGLGNVGKIFFIPYKAGEIMLQCRDLDGTMDGYHLGMLKILQGLRQPLESPIIVSGGCSGPADMLAAFQAGADACAAGALFQFTDTTPRDCSEYMRAHGVEMRCA